MSLIHDPRWYPHSHRFLQHIPPEMQDWLFDQGSLTARIVAACCGAFRVEVLSQGWQRPLANEARRLGIKQQHYAWVRQVRLFCGDTPWVFARTVIPRTTLSGAQRHLAGLGAKPLGAVLFADPGMTRDPLEVARLLAPHYFHAAAVQGLANAPDLIWGRRSVFYLQQKPLLVNEIFLPALKYANV